MTDVEVATFLRIGSRLCPAVLCYDRAEPFTARLEVDGEEQPDGEDLVWEFSRDLLRDGLHGPAGYGDVRVWPVGNRTIHICLIGEDVVDGCEKAETAAIPRDRVRRFVDAVYWLVPDGHEADHLHLDDHLARLLA